MRDVVAHLVGWDDLLLYRTRREHAIVLAKFLFLYSTSLATMKLVNERIQRRTRDEDPSELARRFASDDGETLKWLFDGTNPGAHLAEYLIHHEDIRGPLGLRSVAPLDRVVLALDGVTRLPGVRISAWWRLRRTRVELSDVDWSRGRGIPQTMTAHRALMWLAGRRT